jgi:hydrogenase nickel incorporation protein HypA/HybF
MHEFSIAISIVEAAQTEADKVDAKEITELVLEIGTMAGIEFEALETALEAAVRDTNLEKTNIRINKIQAVGQCIDCKNEFDINDFLDPCPKCGGLYHQVLSGKELKIKSIVVDT